MACTVGTLSQTTGRGFGQRGVIHRTAATWKPPALYSASSSCAARTGLSHQEIDKRLLRCPAVSDVGILAVDPLGPVGWGFHRSDLLRHKHIPTDAWSDWDLSNLEGRIHTLGSLGQSFVPAHQQCLGGWCMSNGIHTKRPLCWMININCFICWWLW